MRKLAFFAWVYRVSRATRERLTPAGMLLASATGFAGALGLDTQSNLAHAFFALGVGLLGVDAAAASVSRRRLGRLVARRQLPHFATVGTAIGYRVALGNDGARETPGVGIAERLRQPWPTALPDDAGRRAGNRFDRQVGYPAFLEALLRLRTADIAPVACPPLAPGARTEVTVTLSPRARGMAALEGMSAVVTGVLGLVATRVPVVVEAAGRGGDTVTVLPRFLPFEVPPASSRRLLQPGGIALAQRVGDSEEFRSLRDYRPGDPLRAIHWRSFARTGRPLVREYQEEYFARQALLIDTAIAEPFAPALETAVSLAAWMVTRRRDADGLLDMMFVGDRVHRLTLGRGLGGGDALLRVLAGVAPTPPQSIAALFASVERHAAQLSSVVAILLAWDRPRREAVQRLVDRGLRPSVVVVGHSDAAAETDAGFAGLVRHVPVGAEMGGP